MFILIVFGILYLVFAFHEPPKAIAHFFRIPVISVFFAPERRVKLGRIITGALLIAFGASGQLVDLYYRIFGWHGAIPHRGGPLDGAAVVRIILGIVVVGVWSAARWKRAGEVVEADDAERRAQWQSFEQLKHDPRFLQLRRCLDTKHRTTFDPPLDPTTYRIAYISLMGASYESLLAPRGAGARYVVAFLQRRDAPSHIQVTLDLQTGTCGDVEMGSMMWNGMIPNMTRTP